ncbi:MAG: hypothetical protein D6734_12945 [Candidatus Schekmanbacteria bacterium]|nr:MAG: hypothetical protein D6734_12945 [Candidatus Schekmanbacteria bacterium]
MTNSREAIRKELNTLLEQGISFLAPGKKEGKPKKQGKSIQKVSAFEYQDWYTKALAVVRQLIPDRLKEFEELYKIEKRKEIDYTTYTISDYLLGLSVTRGIYKEEIVNPEIAFISKFQQQLAILRSAYARLDSILSDITGVLRADLFDNEIDAARSLLKAKHLRAAGTVAGVVLENHLSTVCNNHQISIKKKSPTIADYNDSLKNGGILDVPTWRWIQRLGDIRNLCCHAKDRDPTIEEVQELVDGVEKAVKTLF